ncbi:MAG: signal peptidase I [Lachnospiraceae bacterium]|nr:signal peptidase I [Lachnospiraceae bacterium]
MTDSDATRQPEETASVSLNKEGDTSGFDAMADQIRTEQKNSRRKRVLIAVDTLLICAVAALLAILVRAFLITPLKIDGDSMEEALHNGDILLLSKLTLRQRDPGRYEVVVASKTDGKGHVVKRVIGLPGEVIYADRDGMIHIYEHYENGQYSGEVELLEQFAYATTYRGKLGTEDDPLILADNEFFLIGDNRPVSKDSRFYGPFPRECLIGVAVYRIFPLTRFGKIY